MKHFKSLQKQEILQLLTKGFIIYTLHKNAQIFAKIQGQLQAARFSPIWEDKALINGGLMGDIDLMGRPNSDRLYYKLKVLFLLLTLLQ